MYKMLASQFLHCAITAIPAQLRISALLSKEFIVFKVTDLEYSTDFCIVLKYSLHTHSNKVFYCSGLCTYTDNMRFL